MDIDEILARAEKVETKATNEVEGGNELLNAFKVYSFVLFPVTDKHRGNGVTMYWISIAFIISLQESHLYSSCNSILILYLVWGRMLIEYGFV